MKRILSLTLVFICLFTLVACSSNDEGRDVLNPHFTGKVIEKHENSCLIEVTDIGNGHLALGSPVVVTTNIPNCPEYEVGDYLIIVFDGTVAESYPPQILRVSTITKTDSSTQD